MTTTHPAQQTDRTSQHSNRMVAIPLTAPRLNNSQNAAATRMPRPRSQAGAALRRMTSIRRRTVPRTRTSVRHMVARSTRHCATRYCGQAWSRPNGSSPRGRGSPAVPADTASGPMVAGRADGAPARVSTATTNATTTPASTVAGPRTSNTGTPNHMKPATASQATR